jgi:ABC-type uncharacterized transport system fused permease/ATPase subunit
MVKGELFHATLFASRRTILKPWFSTVKAPSLDTLFWEEMSRQEAWHRDFKNNLPKSADDIAFTERQKEEESRLREECDLRGRH